MVHEVHFLTCETTKKESFHGYIPRKCYSIKYLNTPTLFKDTTLINRLSSNDQINGDRAMNNSELGPDDRIEPPLNLIEGKPPRAGTFPRTKREALNWTRWTETFRELNWKRYPQDDDARCRRTWWGKTGTRM
ncbi:hypothetical protein BJ508DRAFT_307651 [Ascobolus immersus RN42]|uniref:Uncharacterized protein n=1 Tax=Ascobolus immersus RN42 TaxID=1160509 RepID=A0A3N4I818_ASCIM|nr:hypothetical protein BJ508DRAFT_307651 [Ascobolus immersus RN42]